MVVSFPTWATKVTTSAVGPVHSVSAALIVSLCAVSGGYAALVPCCAAATSSTSVRLFVCAYGLVHVSDVPLALFLSLLFAALAID